MIVVEISLNQLQEATWNPNFMDEKMLNRLKESLSCYGLVEPLVVRPLGDSVYEALSGNQRLKAIKELGLTKATCVIVDLNDQDAMLLAQALNSIKGEDDLSRKSELFKIILTKIPEEKVLSILPETAASIKALSSLGQEEIAENLKAWQKKQNARLRHLQFQLTSEQLKTVDEAINKILPEAKKGKNNSPNKRGTALHLLCKYYLDHEGGV